MAWAGIVALLRDRFNANEILVSLMLVYVAEHAAELPGLRAVEGPGRLQLPADHHLRGRRPRSRGCSTGSRVNIGLLIALAARRRVLGVPVPHLRRLPAAGRRAGAGGGALRGLLVARARCGSALLISGGMAGLAGALEVAGPLGQLTPLRAGGLRLRRDHRRLRRPAASGRHRVLGDADEHVLHRRRAGAVAPRPAQVADRRVPGPAAVHAAGLRHADRTTACAGSTSRRAGARSTPSTVDRPAKER